MALNVSKWSVSRPRWSYTPCMWFYKRMIEVAEMVAMTIGADGTPTDDALLARDWFATSEMEPEWDGQSQFVSFAKCCEALGANYEVELVAFLAKIDANCDFDSDECWKRLEYLQSRPLEDDEEPLYAVPDWARVVPARDQVGLWNPEDLAPVKRKREKLITPGPIAAGVAEVAQLGFVM